jgi:hypothetical protein
MCKAYNAKIYTFRFQRLYVFFLKIHPKRCTNHIEERSRKPEPQVSLPTGGGSSPITKKKPNVHPATKKKEAQGIQRTRSGKG